MRRLVLFVPLLLAATGCQQPPAADLATMPPAQDEAYECVRETSDGPAALGRRIVILHAASSDPRIAGATALALDFGDRRSEILPPVSGAGGRLFANDRYAWRANGPAGADGTQGGVLTDVERIATYECVFSGRSGDKAAGPQT